MQEKIKIIFLLIVFVIISIALVGCNLLNPPAKKDDNGSSSSSSSSGYSTDFSTDPGWNTNNSSHYYWDSSIGNPAGSLCTTNYTNSQEWITTPINYNGESFSLDFDIMPTTRDTGDCNFGLLGPLKLSDSTNTEERLYVEIGGYNNQIYIDGYNSGGESIYSGAGNNLMADNQWHHFHITYNASSLTINFTVTCNNIVILPWQMTMSYGFSNNLKYLGATMSGSWITSNRYELAYIDNVQFYLN